MNLALIGYRGTGKSSVARLLGQMLSWPSLDADELLEERAGRSIAEIFATDGEEAFRDLETEIVAELAQRPDCVLALGGGAVLREKNRQLLRAGSRVVWLQASPKTLWQRLADDPQSAARRPNLTERGGLDEIIATVGTRTPIYRQCADLAVDTEGKAPADVAAEILRHFAFLLHPQKPV